MQSVLPSQGEAFNNALFQSLRHTMEPGHNVRLLWDNDIFLTLPVDIERSRQSIHVVMYIWSPSDASSRLRDAIVERMKKDNPPACRILVDAFGSPDFDEKIAPSLRKVGCEVGIFRATANDDLMARNHRKIFVIDGRVGYTGGVGIRDEWWIGEDGFGPWRETNIRFEGPAVRSAQQAFAEHWQESGGALLPSYEFPPDEVLRGNEPARAAFVASHGAPVVSEAERLTQLLIVSSSKRLWISNAYFVPSQPILDLLALKANEGVDVRILVPGSISDSTPSFMIQQFLYGGLLEYGVRVFEYQRRMMHAKTMVVDDTLSLVGSINLEPLSLTSLEDAALVVEDSETNRALAEKFLEDCGRSEEKRP